MRRRTKTEYLAAIAAMTAEMSTCSRLHVGCVLTNLGHEQIWVGYNGGPRGGPNRCRHEDEVGGCGCVHAEANAVIKAPGDVEKIAVLTHSPCPTCAVMLVNAHVVELHYGLVYRDAEGLDILTESGVQVELLASSAFLL